MKSVRATIKRMLPSSIRPFVTNLYLKTKFTLFGPTAFVPRDIQARKTNLINDFQARYQCDTLVETGTYMGDMVEAQKGNFKQVISVELAPHLAAAAKKRFVNDANVTIIEGDSAKVLHTVVPTLTTPAIFWLDGHYSAGLTAKGDTECPIYGELDAILKAASIPHIILIDDADDFTGDGDYPTIDALTEYIHAVVPTYQTTTKDNIICYYR